MKEWGLSIGYTLKVALPIGITFSKILNTLEKYNPPGN